jgi:stress response protein YsnF
MNYEKIVTLFDTAQHAEAAKRNLESAGFPPGEISTINSRILAGDKLNEPGLWRRLFGRDIQPYEAIVYGRSVEGGGVVLTVRVPESEVAKATRILNSHEAVDLQQRAVQQGLITKTTTNTAQAPTVTAPPVGAPPPAVMAAGRTMPDEQVLRLAEEQLDVGKRVIEDGTMRIRRFVTETPVEAQVTLHEEHTRIIRRASADPAFIRDVDWTDKTIEMSEMVEEPIINKSVHVAEEVVIRKEATDTVRTVKDKVRRQHVEVEKVPGRGPVESKR